nr:Rne/Rng family ribonuclease [Boudabousia marimammalium]
MPIFQAPDPALVPPVSDFDLDAPSRKPRKSKDREDSPSRQSKKRQRGERDEDSKGSSRTRERKPRDEEEEEYLTETRRRRRRRSRTSDQTEPDEPNYDPNYDPKEEVTALKGSTRLEAKRQRRREGRKDTRKKAIVTEAEFLARRESVDRLMVVRERDGLNQIAVIEDGLLVEHYVARHAQTSKVGNVYVGKIQNVLPSMEAAFVDIGEGRNGVLYAGEVNWDATDVVGKQRRIEKALSPGDSVLVQVTKDPIGHKGARLTSQVTLAGRYLVLVPSGSMTGISRKLPEKERQRLKKILRHAVPKGCGVIVRTAAEGASEEQIRDDIERLTVQWEQIEKKQKQKKVAPFIVRSEPELAVRVVRDIFNEDFNKLIVSGDSSWKTIKAYVKELAPELSDRLEHYKGEKDVFEAYRVDQQLAKAMDRKAWLPSGGSLVIDRTEAMTVIDVNTGRYTGAGGTLEETVTKNNLEAAEEIVRQLRLRDIGGIIVIDFVDMVLESNRDLVLRRLVECLGRDRTRHQVSEVTALGLVQMTRKRVGQGLVEAFSTECEACRGRGFIVHDAPIEREADDVLDAFPKGRKGRRNSSERNSTPSKNAEQAAQKAQEKQEEEHAKVAAAITAIAKVTQRSEAELEDIVKPELERAERSKQQGKNSSGKKAPQKRGRREAKASVSVSTVTSETEAPASEKKEETSTPKVRGRGRRRAATDGVVTATASNSESSASAGAAAKSQKPEQRSAPSGAATRLAGAEAPRVRVPAARKRRRAATTGVVTPGA